MATRIVDLGSVIGPQGPQGPAGAAGTQGPQGAAGAAGKNAYQYAVEGGYSGTEAQFKAKLAKEYLPLGGGDMAGIIDMNNKVITGLPSPTAPSDAVNLQTLVKAMVGSSNEAIAIVEGTSGGGTMVTGYVPLPLKTVRVYGTDVVLAVSGTLRPSNIDCQTITDVVIQLPPKFRAPSGDWSDVSIPMKVQNKGISSFNFSVPVQLLFSQFSETSNSIEISGEVRMGVVL